jgi:hypothetical protein
VIDWIYSENISMYTLNLITLIYKT